MLTDVKAISSYLIPRVDVQVAASFQSSPGPLVQGTYNAPNSVVSPSLGRVLSGNQQNVQVNLLGSNAVATALTTASAGVLYGDRMNQLDLRVGKIFRFGQRRVAANLDVYNVTNANAVLSESTAYATFRVPQTILIGRFVKVSAQLDF